MRRTDPNTKTVQARYAQLTTEVDYNLIEGCFDVRLNPDAEKLPGTLTSLAPDEARELARDLLAQADEADRRDGATVPRPVTRVRRFLDQQLNRDDMTLAEIAASVVDIVLRGREG